jgi:tetratricopeptide (TPR) repeat protein
MRATASLVLAIVVLACAGAGGPPLRAIEQDLDDGRYEEAIQKLEAARKQYPDSIEVPMELARAHFRLARKADDEGRPVAYVEELGLAQDALVQALEIDPEFAPAHTWMGILLAYKGEIRGGLESFLNARRLNPRNPTSYTNLAETHIYMGNISAARSALDKARKLGARRAVIEMNEVLAAWRQGDYVEARDIFDGVYAMNPDVVKTWNEAPVSDPIESFEDFTEFCCGHVACGPYMENACQEMDQEIAHHSLEAELVRRELELEMDRRRKLREIYKGRKDLEVTVEAPEPVD